MDFAQDVALGCGEPHPGEVEDEEWSGAIVVGSSLGTVLAVAIAPTLVGNHGSSDGSEVIF